ncbi:MAG: glycosyltransferase, partial [Anaerolineae bacterium]
MRRIRVLSVDDYAPLRVYLRTIFDLEDEIELVGEAENGAQAIEEARRLRPDVIIMDVDMPVLDGLEATRQILREQPQAKVVFLVAEVTWRTEAQAVGASAFLLKDTPPDELVATVLAQVRAPVAPKPVAVPAGPRAAPVWASLWQRLSLLGRASSQATADAWTSVRRWLVQEQWPRLKDPSFQRSFRRTLVLVAGLAAAVAIARTVDVAALARQITLGGAFSFISLFFGVFFFVYAARYYASIALILAIGGNGNGRNGNGYPNGNGNGLRRNGFVNSLRRRIANGLQNHNGNDNGNGNGFHLDRQPFVSIHLPTYNEQRVIDRLLTACTSFDYENYEVIVADDSADGTLDRLGEWAKHPKVKVSHRINRKGFKGAALKKTMEIIDPRTEFVIIYDADFVPGPDMIQQYLAYFYGPNGANGNHNGGKGHPSSGNGGNNGLADEKVAAVQGYQWHMLNADENWITKGVRAEYSGSYVVERSGQELVGTMKMISGSVYMIRADVLRQIGWGTSITEDWELTIKLYLAGYKVLYTPFIQAPAECVNSFKQLVKQRMRWAEGHTYQVKKY